MSDESTVEIPENQQVPETAESESDSDDPALAALIKRYGLTLQQAKEMMMYL